MMVNFMQMMGTMMGMRGRGGRGRGGPRGGPRGGRP